jgi:hypothetical protein
MKLCHSFWNISKKNFTGMKGIKGMKKKKESLKIPSIPFIPVNFWFFWNQVMSNMLVTITQNGDFHHKEKKTWSLVGN